MIKKIIRSNCVCISYMDKNDIRYDIFIVPLNKSYWRIIIWGSDGSRYTGRFKLGKQYDYVTEYLITLKAYDLRFILNLDSSKEHICIDIIECLREKQKDFDLEEEDRERLIDLLRKM